MIPRRRFGPRLPVVQLIKGVWWKCEDGERWTRVRTPREITDDIERLNDHRTMDVRECLRRSNTRILSQLNGRTWHSRSDYRRAFRELHNALAESRTLYGALTTTDRYQVIAPDHVVEALGGSNELE